MYRKDDFIPLVKEKLSPNSPIPLQSKVRFLMYVGKGSNTFILWFCRLDKKQIVSADLRRYNFLFTSMNQNLCLPNHQFFLLQKLSNSMHTMQNQINGTEYIYSFLQPMLSVYNREVLSFSVP
jgi:hypothetical protein